MNKLNKLLRQEELERPKQGAIEKYDPSVKPNKGASPAIL